MLINDKEIISVSLDTDEERFLYYTDEFSQFICSRFLFVKRGLRGTRDI